MIRVITSGLATILFASVTAPAVAAARADLAINKVTSTTAALSGGKLTVTATVKNVGNSPAGASKTSFYLSKDAKKNAGDAPLGGTSLAKIVPGAGKTARLTATVPSKVKPGSYRVVACADSARKVRESRETNNCASSRMTTQISAPYDPTPFGAVDPVAVEPVVDSSTTVSTRVSAVDGGRLELALSDGTTFTLDVPPGALLQDEEITMTALTKVSGDPFGGGFVAGVKLAPEGLTFMDTAFLTIHPATPLPPGTETPFSAQGDGDDFHLHPVMVQPSDPTFPVKHFSLFGLFETTPEERAAQLARNAADSQAAFDQQIADVITGARERGGDEAFTDAEIARLYDLFARYYDLAVRPLLIAALNDHTRTDAALQRAASWDRMVSLLLLGTTTPEITRRLNEMRELIEKVMVNYAGKVFDRCIREHDLGVVQELISIHRQAELLGIALPGEMVEKINRCSTFEIEFESTLERTANSENISGGETFRVGAVLLFRLNELPIEAALTQDGAYSGDWMVGDCSSTPDHIRAGTITLEAFDMNMNIKWVDDPRDPTRERPIVQGIGLRPVETTGVHRICSGDLMDTGHDFETEWGTHHADELVRDEYGNARYWMVGPFQESSEVGVIATGVFEHFLDLGSHSQAASCWNGALCGAGYNSQETTVITLRHKPQS